MEESPFELEDEVKYNRLLMPVSCCLDHLGHGLLDALSALAPG